ncbi:Carboxy-terminal processing protease CtpA [Acaryochloris thomasi RCC1774]|uniref:Carboxy-terminal processing protease CtpA n=1 Tax=Acaryochloris thomasi RCC1774 TaxID=1764569 RepID=A0A2W1K0K9_9CYAN|nr:carboxyl-terminal processing protease CtpB [Acaryochloris thomasi]PZD74151.1 Carboxy-terminal processing protease CtpA [Acaryochloris thomasi RCC1774]
MNPTSRSLHSLQTVLFGGAVVVSASGIGLCWQHPAEAALEDSPKVIVDEAWQLVNRHYVDETFNKTDWKETRRELLSRNYTSTKQAYTALREALQPLNDPYTRFMAPSEYESLTSQTSGELSGVGIRMEINKKTKVLTVVEPLPGSPATKAGLTAGDRIIEIDGKPTAKLDIKESSKLIRGQSGTQVKFLIQRKGTKKFEVAIERAVIELSAVTSRIQREGGNRIGYIRLNEFSAHASEQIKAAIERLTAEKADGFVLDLRGNPGGLLNASIDIADMWLDRGLIVRTVNRQGTNENVKARTKSLTQKPLAVLVDGNSASSSEILTGALQDNGRAKVIGSTTFGKALVQSVHQLSDGSGLAVTVAHYYTPKGTDINHKGITPDIQVKLSEGQKILLSTNPKMLATFSDPHYTQAIRTLQQGIRAQKGQPDSTVINKAVVPKAFHQN